MASSPCEYLGAFSVLFHWAAFTGLYNPAPSQLEFLWAPHRSLVCFVLPQEKAVLKENKILMMILAVFPQECVCVCVY